MRLNAQRAAILIVDLQRAFCCDDGSVAAQGHDISTCRAAADRSIALVAAARQGGLPVFWTRLCFLPDYTDGGLLISELRPGLRRIGALKDGTPDAYLVPEAGVAADDFVIAKQRYSAFHETPLEAILRSRSIDTLLVGGVTTSMCVESTVRDAAQRDYRVFVVADACGDFDVERHRASLAAMAFGFACTITIAEAVAAIAAGQADFPRQ
jgi:nicotinamidase-related amidase